MINFILKDFVSLLSFILFLGGFALLVLVIILLAKGEDKHGEEQPLQEPQKTEISPVESRLELISREISVLKDQLADIQNSIQNKPAEPAQQTQLNGPTQEDIDKINSKLDALYRLIAAR